MNIRHLVAASVMALATAAPLQAELVRADPGGITVVHTVRLQADKDKAYAAFGQIGRFWSEEHTWGGKASAMTLALKAGGCFCEALPGGGVEHGRVIIAMKGQQITMQSLLGPASQIATSGILNIAFAPAPEGETGSDVTLTYRLSGISVDEVVPMGRAIDQVLGEQMANYAAFAGGERVKVTKE